MSEHCRWRLVPAASPVLVSSGVDGGWASRFGRCRPWGWVLLSTVHREVRRLVMRWHWVKAGVLSAVLVAAGAVAPASATGTAPAGGHAAPPNFSEAFTLVVSTV